MTCFHSFFFSEGGEKKGGDGSCDKLFRLYMARDLELLERWDIGWNDENFRLLEVLACERDCVDSFLARCRDSLSV